MKSKLKYIFIFGVTMFFQILHCQKRVAITIDDVPNTSLFEKDDYQSILLEKLDSLEVPIAIFINEGLIYKTDSVSKNFDLLNNWVKNEYITLGNHTFIHSRYSTIGVSSFLEDIKKGEFITRELAGKYNKNLTYFRFPFNDLGRDSLQHIRMRKFLTKKRYKIAPFTIESSDWMYNRVYRYYLDTGDLKRAKEIGGEYVEKTLEYFDFFEQLALEDYNRPINQMYLCHDNKLNTDFLPKLLNELEKKGYQFISIDEALRDDVYSQKNDYFKKWGISWLYRWKTTQKERIKKMKKEPSTKSIIEVYEGILKKRKREE